MAAQASVATQPFLEALVKACHECRGQDRFSTDQAEENLRFKFFRSWAPRQKTVCFSLPFEGTIKKVVGYASHLEGLRGAPFYERRIILTFCPPSEEEIYIGKYWIPLVPRDRCETPRRDCSEDFLARRIAEIDTYNSFNPPQNITELAARWERDPQLAMLLKHLRGDTCQICSATFKVIGGGSYSECHHLEQLANGGLDVSKNMLVLCANHHRQFHYGHVSILEHSNEHIIVEIDGLAHHCSLMVAQNAQAKEV